ncbi:probable polygalacturonase At3g15720 [Salvia miltiorrhiza]|uniref:probable polygalacturonase At3g15720 n=1 Tax=Salvia miltiorrhiza TaxID=226208 RepID=UPI0025ACB65E|nr:probable polygalacturonase At3g15720 [Salvia miltiorrhiza]
MDTFASVLILWLAFWASSMVINARPNLQDDSVKTYDVAKFGAVGDGITDDTKAFKSAWEAACKEKREKAKIAVASGKTFLVSQIEFKGPCSSTSIIFEILGKIVAPPRSAWEKKGADEWLYFHRVDGLTLVGEGQGVIDGRGETWWKNGDTKSRPTAMRFSHCNKLQVRGLKHRNSQKNHVSINGCNSTTISDLVITAPQKSPNTDGIDISGSTDLRILDSVMETGDDCIAINGGTSNVSISNINCGPGHGISIGSLGKKGKHDEVEAINIRNCTFNRSDNGVRIKTWQGGSGFARNIKFSQIIFIEANNPVIIDQYYCPHKKCATKKSAVKVSDVGYYGLHGTTISKNATINFSCSKTVPCTNIIVEDVDIESANPNHPAKSHCTNAYGTAHALRPILDCLLK